MLFAANNGALLKRPGAAVVFQLEPGPIALQCSKMATADNEPGAEPAPVDASHQLQLCTRPLRFPPVDAATSVFYDEALRQVFTVRGGGMHVTVSSLDSPESTNLSFPSRGPVVSVKFSLDKRILAIQRTSRTIVSCQPFCPSLCHGQGLIPSSPV